MPGYTRSLLLDGKSGLEKIRLCVDFGSSCGRGGTTIDASVVDGCDRCGGGSREVVVDRLSSSATRRQAGKRSDAPLAGYCVCIQ